MEPVPSIPDHEFAANREPVDSLDRIDARLDAVTARTQELLDDAVDRLTVGLLSSMASMLVIFLVLVAIL